MVDESYMLARPSGPGRAKAFADRTAFPALIDAAAMLERVLEQAAAFTRRSPLAALGASAGLGWLAARIAGRGSGGLRSALRRPADREES